MPNLKDLKNRIDSVKSTRKITKAMQMVAAAKLRRAQESAEASRPYAQSFSTVLGALAQAAGQNEGAPPLLAGNGREQTHLLVVMTAERGLCGGFNSSIAKLAAQRAEALLVEGKKVNIMTVGKKGREQLRRNFEENFVDHIDLSEVKNIEFSNAQAIASKILEQFEAGAFDVATIFYNRFQSVIAQVPTETQLIPVAIPENDGEVNASSVYSYEPDGEEILEELLPRAIATQVFSALLENGASEQGARMSAMDNATRNAGEMIDKLTIQFNRSRQAAITNELIEIISGAEAL